MAGDAVQRDLCAGHCPAGGRSLCGQPDQCTAVAEPCALPCHGAHALCLYHAGIGHERSGFQGCQAHPAQQHLRKACPPWPQLHRDGGHQRGGDAGQRRRGADRYLFCKVPAPAVLQPTGSCYPVRAAGGCARTVCHHPAVLRAADPHVHRGGAEVCQKAAGELLGRVHHPWRQLSGKHSGPDHPEDLSGRRLEARADERAG